jgi:hypothetical protein
VFENKVLKKIFGRKRDVVMEERRKLLNDQYKNDEMGRALNTNG